MGFNIGGLFGGGNGGDTTTSTTNNDPTLNTQGGDITGMVASGTGNTLYGAGAQTSVAQIEGSSNVINMLDQGAVSNSLALALKGVELANQNASQAQTQTAGLLQGVFDAQGSVTKQLASAVETVKTTDLRAIGLGALVIVAAVVGVVYMRKA